MGCAMGIKRNYTRIPIKEGNRWRVGSQSRRSQSSIQILFRVEMTYVNPNLILLSSPRRKKYVEYMIFFSLSIYLYQEMIDSELSRDKKLRQRKINTP